jgi:LysR family glycine cleavage system transcriptional activator
VPICAVDLEREALECAIAYGDGKWPEVCPDFLRDESLMSCVRLKPF